MVLQQLAQSRQSVRSQASLFASRACLDNPFGTSFSNRVRKLLIRLLLRRTSCRNERKLTVAMYNLVEKANMRYKNYFLIIFMPNSYLRRMWEPYKKGYKAWLQLERSLSDNSIEAYLRDIDKLTQYLQAAGSLKSPGAIE